MPPATMPEAAALVAVVAGGLWVIALSVFIAREARVRWRARVRRSPSPITISLAYQEFMESLEDR